MESPKKKRLLQWILPIALTMLTLAGSAGLMTLDRGPQTLALPEPVVPRVTVIHVTYETTPLTVHLSGTVSPLRLARISCEVTGKVAYVSDKLVTGGHFRKDELMLQVEDGDYADGLAEARAALAEARLAAEKEEELARQAAKDWQDLGQGVPTDLALRRPNLAAVRARVASAEALLEKARRSLARTRIRSPFDCMVSSVSVAQGMVVSPGPALFEIFGVGTAEIRLPLSPEDAGFIDLPRPGTLSEPVRKVSVLWQENGDRYVREGYVVRTEGAVDPSTRFQYLVVRVDDPYGFTRPATPLKIGSFVTVGVRGKRLDHSVLLPGGALSEGRRVMRVAEGSRIEFVPVDLLRRAGGKVLVRGDLGPGQRIVVSSPEGAVDGMRVDIDDTLIQESLTQGRDACESEARNRG